MADVFCDEFASAEGLADEEDFVFASGDDCIEEEQNKDEIENTEQEEQTSDDVKVGSASDDSSKSNSIFEKLASSDYVQDRRICAQSIVEQLHLAESKEELLSAISRMSKLGDDEEYMVRSELMPRLPYIALFCKEHSEDLSAVIRQQVVPYTVKLLTDEQIVVRKVGHSSLKVLLENNILDNSQLNDWICPLISELVTFGTSEELRSEDVSGMCKMIPFIGKEITEKFFLSPFISLCCDSAFTIRKVCAVNFGSVCKVVGMETTETTLLPAFLNLCNDEVWGIRKECADVFVDVANTVTDKTRREILPHIFISLLNDESRYVKLAAYQSLGGFIATFADPSKTGWQYIYGFFVEAPLEGSTNCQQEKEYKQTESRNSSEIQCQKDRTNQSKQLNLNFDSSKQTNLKVEQTDLTNSNFELLDKITEKESGSNNLSDSDFVDNCSIELNSTQLNSNSDLIEYPAKVIWLKDNCTKKSRVRRRDYRNFSQDSNMEITDVKSAIVQTNLSGHSPFSDNEHVDNENVFNNFQFWRTPLPEVEVDLEIDKHATMHLTEDACTTINLSESSRIMHVVPATNLRNCLSIEVEKVNELANINIFSKTPAEFKRNEEKSTRLSNVKSKTSKEMTVYDQDIVPPELLTKFLSGVHEEENTSIFAYSFPAIACTLGGKYWPCVRAVCFLLAGDLKYTVRRTVASFLHELASFLGHDIIIEDLLPIFLKMSKDIDDVRIKVLQYLDRFLLCLSPIERRQFLPFIEELLTIENENNWRFRFTVAEQLIPCVTLFDLSEVQTYFLPVCLALMNDKACDVRRCAIQLLAVIMKSFLEDPTSTYEQEVLSLLENYIGMYKQEKKWLQRQMYVFICQELASKRSLPNELYVEKVVPGLFSLAWDPVPNVRLAVARCLSLTLLPLGYLPSIQKSHYQLLLQVMYSLQSDIDRDVRHFAHLSAGAFNVLPQKKLSPV